MACLLMIGISLATFRAAPWIPLAPQRSEEPGRLSPSYPIQPEGTGVFTAIIGFRVALDVLAYGSLVGGISVGPNTNGATVFRCPVENTGWFAAEGSSYEWNAALNGLRMGETRTDDAFLLLQKGDPTGGITNFVLTLPPGTTPLLLDYDPVHSRPPKFGKNVVFIVTAHRK